MERATRIELATFARQPLAPRAAERRDGPQRPATASLVTSAFGTTPEVWVDAQPAYDLAWSRPYRTIKRVGAAA